MLGVNNLLGELRGRSVAAERYAYEAEQICETGETVAALFSLM